MNLFLLWIYMYSFNCGCPFLNIEWSSLAKNYMYMLKLYTITVQIPLLLKYIITNFKLSKFHKNWNYAWVRLVNLNMSLTLNFSLALCCMRFYMFGIKCLVTHRARYLFRHLRIIKKDCLKPVIENQTQECFYGYMSNWMLVYLCENNFHI